MNDKRSFFDNLMHRRVPQIVGMYVAASWLVIELGDWVTERFNLPTEVTSYVFIAMLVMLPAVILFAYNHGAPGRDQWTKGERVFIPLNAVIAMVVLYAMGPQLEVEAATETVQIPDETGTVQEFEVARQGYHQKVVSFFWQNDSGDSDLDWLSYGLPLMLAHDLNRVSPVISVQTPFDSTSVQSELRSNGYPDFLNEPQGLRLEIARDRRSAALIVGSFSELDGVATVNAKVLDAESGQTIAEYSVSGSDWLVAVDDVTAAVLQSLEVEPSDNQSDDPVGQHFSSSLEAIEHYTYGEVAIEVSNDFPTGIAELESAVAIDPEFAEASGVLSIAHYLNSDLASAREAASQALRNDYRLSETSKFIVKANRYIFDGDYDRGLRVVEIWTRVQPNSTDALAVLAQISIVHGTTESLQTASDAYDRLLELDPKDFGVYRRKAEVELQRGDFAAAADYLQTFLEHEPDSGAAHLQLAGVYQSLGDLEAAQESLEDAAILSDSPLESELGLARLLARRGMFDEAQRSLGEQLNDQLGPEQRVQVLSAQAEVAFVMGQIEEAIALNREINETAKSFMPPMARILGIENQLPDLYVQLGRTEEAIAIADGLAAQLQPPLDAYINFVYTTIYSVADDREAYREWANKTQAVKDQLPPILMPFVEFQSANLAIWDGNFDVAITHLDTAREMLSQSLIQIFQGNLSIWSVHVIVADLYLQAGAIEASRASLEDILQVFPANGYAKLTYAKLLLAEGNTEGGRKALADVLEIWSEANPDYLFLQEAQSLMSSL